MEAAGEESSTLGGAASSSSHVMNPTPPSLMPPSRRAASLQSVIAALETGAGARKLPKAIESLQLRVPRKFENKRDWYVGFTYARSFLRKELPRLVYHNPDLQVNVEHPDNAPPSMIVHFTNMPERTIIFGDKSSGDITSELLAMAQHT